MDDFLGKNPIRFKVINNSEEITYSIGESPSVTGGFYLLKESYHQKRLFLCVDENVTEQVYQK